MGVVVAVFVVVLQKQVDFHIGMDAAVVEVGVVVAFLVLPEDEFEELEVLHIVAAVVVLVLVGAGTDFE